VLCLVFVAAVGVQPSSIASAQLSPVQQPQASPCSPVSEPHLKNLVVLLNKFWSTRAILTSCDGAQVSFGSRALPGIVEYVPEQARQLGFDNLGVTYIVAHEWGHEVQYQRVRDPVALLLGRQPGIFPQARELQADCLAGYFIGKTFGTVPNIEARLMARAASIGDDRILHDQRLAGPLGNFLDVFTPDAHGNGHNRAANIQQGFRLARQNAIAACGMPMTRTLFPGQ
jgi:hypothetical protein